ncbi:hypothetical protein GCM10017752_30100 [Streptomyces roseoviridis]
MSPPAGPARSRFIRRLPAPGAWRIDALGAWAYEHGDEVLAAQDERAAASGRLPRG